MPIHQGFFTPKNLWKWGGVTRVPYLSGWEYRFLVLLDSNDAVKQVAANKIKIPYNYQIDSSQHTYYVDFFVKMVKDDKVSKMFIEIKPEKECFPPKKPKNNSTKGLNNYTKQVMTYIKNQNKWNAASSFSKSQESVFLILTEKSCYSFQNNTLVKISSRNYF